MTENPIVKMADNIRTKVGTTQKFTLPEIASLVFLPDNFPNFNAELTIAQNGVTKPSIFGSRLNVNGGDTITFTYTYTITEPNILRKLVGSNANLFISCPVIGFMDTDYSTKAVAQTIHFLKQDGSDLIPAVTINNGDASYGYINYQVNQPLTSAIADYLATNQPITYKYDNIGSHADAQISIISECRLLLFK